MDLYGKRYSSVEEMLKDFGDYKTLCGVLSLQVEELEADKQKLQGLLDEGCTSDKDPSQMSREELEAALHLSWAAGKLLREGNRQLRSDVEELQQALVESDWKQLALLAQHKNKE